MRWLAFILLGSCVPAAVTPTRCATWADCHLLDHQRVDVVGFYAIWDPQRSKSLLVKLRFEGAESGPFLAAANAQVYKRSPGEIARFRGRRVRVIGTYLRRIPQRNDDSAQLTGSCIKDIVDHAGRVTPAVSELGRDQASHDRTPDSGEHWRHDHARLTMVSCLHARRTNRGRD